MVIERTYTRSELRWMDRLLLLLVGAGLLVIWRGYEPLAGAGLVLLGVAGNLRLRQVLRDGGTESVPDR